MRRVLDTLGLRALQLRHLSLSQPGRLHRSLADHGRLLQAYEDRDATLASALTRSLVLRGFAAIESFRLERRPIVTAHAPCPTEALES